MAIGAKPREKLHGKGRGKDEGTHLHELRSLNREACNLNPAPRAVDAFSHNREKDDAEENDAQTPDDARPPEPEGKRHPVDDERRRSGETNTRQMALELPCVGGGKRIPGA